ncbi:uracil-DNA glycosylase [Parasulfuritortus cantonensis]|uniref:Type-5 uracil-DNA glycosylase n=1 Tax=Parasulfuritortus cantonensis TaxID=2528202 RepID=A0A4R1BL46_9PROT|nr:uracil-DNA glycosylase [Parasulfuritortus cantonensis]TCJ18145.1 uracil-DNA glycosylase [Parasulfuritortus cantonensis]
MSRPAKNFDAECAACPRLAEFLATTRRVYPDYFCRPVPPFGDPDPRLLIVGLAPGLHGANRTGRPFTGDFAGQLLYETLHEFGYADRPVSVAADDGLSLSGCRITNAVKCVPPGNKPEPAEIRRCNGFLQAEIASLQETARVLALGQVAHGAVLRALGLKASQFPFGHGGRHVLPDGRRLYDSYHCSRYNTQTRRLTPAMFKAVFASIRNDME